MLADCNWLVVGTLATLGTQRWVFKITYFHLDNLETPMSLISPTNLTGKQRKTASTDSKSPTDRKLDELIDAGIARIRSTWADFQRGELHGPYGKQQILESL